MTKTTTPKPPLWARGWFITLTTLTLITIATIGTVLAFPQQTLGPIAKFVSTGPAPNTDEILDGHMPETSVLRDKDGNIITYFYDQRRSNVESNEISQDMKNAIIAIEDRRFYEHDGVDWKGVLRAAFTNISTDDVQGASTLTQQYVKNYTWLITAEDEDDHSSAIEQSYTRKLAEIATAEDITTKLSKEEILTRYLNLVTFGNGSYGVQDAARTYFDTTAAELTPPQAALLAGMVQAPSSLDPYTNYEAAKERRNLVLDAMATTGDLTVEEAESFKQEELGILEAPKGLPNGCASAGNRGFFCDQAVKELESNDISIEELKTGGYDITTTLDPKAQDAAVEAAKAHTPDPAQPITESIVLIQPGDTTRQVRAIASSRDYGYDEGQTSLPVATTQVGHGAGSVFKVFAAAVALEQDYRLDQQLDVPNFYAAEGLGDGGAQGCPAGKYCVTNAGSYAPKMSFTDVMAHSPNTPFIKMAEDVGNPAIVDKAIKMGLRSYTDGEEGSTVADVMRNSGSFVLGPTAVNTMELSNVGATIAAGGVWCAPQTIGTVVKDDEPVNWPATSCERALDKEVAAKLANSLAKDTTVGTAATAAQQTGWGDRPLSAKTGTTDDNQSASFLGFTQGLSGAAYIFNDSDNARPLCSSPLRQCDNGDLFGGKEPARSLMDSFLPIIDEYGGAEIMPLPTSARPAPREESRSQAHEDAEALALGRSEGQATSNLRAAGFQVAAVNKVDNREYSRGQVVAVHESNGRVTLDVTTTGTETAAALGGAGDLRFENTR